MHSKALTANFSGCLKENCGIYVVINILRYI